MVKRCYGRFGSSTSQVGTTSVRTRRRCATTVPWHRIFMARSGTMQSAWLYAEDHQQRRHGRNHDGSHQGVGDGKCPIEVCCCDSRSSERRATEETGSSYCAFRRAGQQNSSGERTASDSQTYTKLSSQYSVNAGFKALPRSDPRNETRNGLTMWPGSSIPVTARTTEAIVESTLFQLQRDPFLASPPRR